jgi:putative sterol carrier protein
MSDITPAFFAVGRLGHNPMLANVTATVRFDLEHEGGTDRWFVVIDKGDVSVSRRNVRADCVLRAERSLVEGVVSGRVNAMAALLRGDLVAEGDPQLLVLLQRLFPVAPRDDDRRPRPAAATAS